MKVELKVHGNDGSVQEMIVESASLIVEADIVEVPPVNGYRCYERLPTSRVMLQGITHTKTNEDDKDE